MEISKNTNANISSKNLKFITKQELLSKYINPETPYGNVIIYHGIGCGPTYLHSEKKYIPSVDDTDNNKKDKNN